MGVNNLLGECKAIWIVQRFTTPCEGEGENVDCYEELNTRFRNSKSKTQISVVKLNWCVSTTKPIYSRHVFTAPLSSPEELYSQIHSNHDNKIIVSTKIIENNWLQSFKTLIGLETNDLLYDILLAIANPTWRVSLTVYS